MADYSISPTMTQLFLYCSLFLFIVGNVLHTYSLHRDIPGPILAKFTDLWRFLLVTGRKSQETYLKLHKRHGDLVRIGPNCISISQPDLIPSIYGIGKGYIKSDFYTVWQNIVNGKRVASMVFTTDEAQHATMKKPIAASYSLSTLKEFEPLLDSTTAVFLSRLDDLFAATGKVCDLGTWLQWYAFDVIGELTFSKRLGFLESGKDVDGIISSVSWNFDRCSALGQMPWLDYLTYKNPLYLRFFAKPVSNPILIYGRKLMDERVKGVEGDDEVEIEIKDPKLREKVLNGTISSKPDFMSRFLTLHEEQPDVVTDSRLLAYLFANINAGSDTIGSTIRAVFYYLLKHPSSLKKLMMELDEAHNSAKLTLPLPTWTECQHLPYLNAVIKEALRLNPALALPMERIVPDGPGLKVGDQTFPPGTIVGINPWVLHRDTRIFGSDAETWEPSRWIAKDEKDAERVKYMDHHLLSFGAGKRTCLGRNIAMLELTKLTPALLMRYHMTLARPQEEWRIINSWVVRQEGLDILLKRRE